MAGTQTHSPRSSKALPLAVAGGLAIAGYWGFHVWQQQQAMHDTRLTTDRYVPLELIEKQQLTSNAFRLRIATEKQPSKTFPVLSCLFVKDDTVQVMRPYTPINPDPYKDGYADLVIKEYTNGSISRMLAAVPLHGKIYVRGPMMEYDYKPNMAQEIGMIAGGTGITPMYQLIRRVLENPEDKTRMWLIYGNQTEEDILLKPELDALVEQHKDRLKVYYLLDEPGPNWTGGRGRVTKAMIREQIQTDEDVKRLVFVCGPDGMLTHVSGQRALDFSQGKVTGLLGQLGFTSDQVWKLQ